MPTEKELMLKQADAETTYQKKLTAGTNITIDPVTNTISSAGGGSTVQYTDNVPSGEAVGILAINGQSHPIHIPRLVEGSNITIVKNVTTGAYTISSTGGGEGTTKSYMGETDPGELVGEDGDLYFKYHKIETVIPTELTLPTLPDDATVPFSITNFNTYGSFTFYYTDGNGEPHNRTVNTEDIVISDDPASEYPSSSIYTWNSYRYVEATRSTNGEGLVLRVCGNCLYKLEANVIEIDLGIDKSYAKVEDTWLPSAEQVEANPEETSQTPLTKIKIDGVTYYIAAGGNAEIIPLTFAEWEALPNTKYSDNKLYLITDSFGTDTIIIPNPQGTPTDSLTKIQIDDDIYEIPTGGSDVIPNPQDTPTDVLNTVEIDGVVYEIEGSGGGGSSYTETVLWSGYAMPQSAEQELSASIENFDAVVLYGAGYMDSNNVSQLNMPLFVPTSKIEYGTNSEISKGYTINSSHASVIRRPTLIFTDATHFVVVKAGNNDDTECGYSKVVGIKYGSGSGGSSDLSAFNFSTDEYKVGVWEDGSIIYQRTIELETVQTINTSAKQITWGSDVADMDLIISAIAQRTDASTYGASSHPLFCRKERGATDKLTFYSSLNFENVKYITVQYTRTTDNDAPWYKIGGGGTDVEANPQGEPTDTLSTIRIGEDIYDIEGSGGSEGEGVEIYSEDEYIVGKWIDGKKLYQRTFVLTNLSLSTSWVFNILGTTGINIVDFDGYYELQINGTTSIQKIKCNFYDTNNYYAKTLIDNDGEDLTAQVYTNAHSFIKGVITIQYTKAEGGE